LDRIATYIVTHHRRIIGATVLITIASLLMFFRMAFNADVAEFMTDGNERGEAFAALQEKYDTGDPVNVLVTLEDGDFADGQALAELREVARGIEGLDSVDSVAAILPDDEALVEIVGVVQMRMMQLQGGTPGASAPSTATVPPGAIPPGASAPTTGSVPRETAPPGVPAIQPPALTADDIPDALAELPPEAIREGLLGSPTAELLISPDKKSTLVMVVPADDAFETVGELREYVEEEAPDGFEYTLSGNPVIWETVVGMFTWFLLVVPPAVIILLLVTFYLNVGDPKLTVMAIVPAAMGSIWTFGFIFGLGYEVDIVTILVPIFVIVMGSADGLHFVMHYQEEVARTDDTVERVTTTLRQIGVPMILTTISTAAGFLSLLVTDVRPIRQMGLFAAVGIVFAGFISFFFLPALLSHARVGAKANEAVLGRRLVAWIKRLTASRAPAVVLSLVLLAFAAYFVPRLEVSSDQLFMFKEGHEIREDFARMEEALGGATPLIGEFTYDPDADPDAEADRILAASEELEALPGVRQVFSAADIVALSEETSPLGAAVGTVELSEDRVTPLGRMVSGDGLRFVLFPEAFETEDLREWLDFAEESDDVRLITGMPVLWDEMARLILRAQTGSLAVAFALVTVMLLLAYRRVKETLISLVPLALTILTLLAFISASGFQLNLVTAILSSIVLGVSIDYAIHFTAAIDYARPSGPGYVLRGIDKAGRPILANALGIAVGLSALWLSPFDIHANISMIFWVSMTTAALTTLIVIPALMARDGVRSASG
jgi:predicted RND superfamily exporter protein